MRRVSQVRIITPIFCHFGLVNVGLRPKKSQKMVIFLYKFSPKGYIPLSDFSKILHREGSPRFAPSRQTLPFWLSKCGLTAPKSPKMLICGIPLPPKGYIPFGDFYKILHGGGSPKTHYSAKFQRSSFKTVAVRHKKSPKMVIFGKTLPLGKNSGGR